MPSASSLFSEPQQTRTVTGHANAYVKKDRNFSPLRTQPVINPKHLSNEELEYVIKTGKVPPKYSTSKLTSESPPSI